MLERLEKGAWSPGHPRVALSGAVGAAPGSVRLQTSAGSRLSASVAQLTGTPLTSGLGGEAQRARGLEPQQEATQHEAGARDGPHGSGSEGGSRHSVVSDLCVTGDHDCEQVCLSSPGSYTCACREGFALNSDGKTCNVCNGRGGSSATDLVFLIDGSKSVRPENFELVKKFINQIVDTLDVSDKLAQVGLVQYSSSVRQEFPLGRFHTKKDIKAAVRNMSYMEKGTMTGAALKYLIDNSFTVSSGARPGAQKVGIVFTDGRSQDYINDAAKKAKDLGFKMFAVGVGNAVEDELREIASEPVAEHYFYTADFKTIDQIGKKLQKKICVATCSSGSFVPLSTKRDTGDMRRGMLMRLQLGLLLLALLLPQEVSSQGTTAAAAAAAATTTKASATAATTKSGVCALQSTVSVVLVSLFLLLHLHC
ncbi:cartilage matrix protein [Puma concolor]|uniref:Cartilage matrix protein n=1 Tax=Puma concolor TaxID=9696 RepID=A0A6P6I177_PUMCO|nr:cartilage matrix protein [Puma concolor]